MKNKEGRTLYPDMEMMFSLIPFIQELHLTVNSYYPCRKQLAKQGEGGRENSLFISYKSLLFDLFLKASVCFF